jgi:hypothetical protein
MNARTLALAALATSFALVGCVAPSDSEADEAVAETADALHDASAMTLNGAPNTYRDLGASGTTVSAVGVPTGTYGYGNEFVTDEWVVEIDKTSNRGLTPIVKYQGPSLDAASCPKARLLGTVYGYVPTMIGLNYQIIPAHWDQIADVTVYGTWFTVLNNAGFCSFGSPNGTLGLSHISLQKHYSLVRVGGAADALGSRQNVQVGAIAD